MPFSVRSTLRPTAHTLPLLTRIPVRLVLSRMKELALARASRGLELYLVAVSALATLASRSSRDLEDDLRDGFLILFELTDKNCVMFMLRVHQNSGCYAANADSYYKSGSLFGYAANRFCQILRISALGESLGDVVCAVCSCFCGSPWSRSPRPRTERRVRSPNKNE